MGALKLGARNIRVNVLAPGTTETRTTAWTKLPDATEAISAAIPLGRLGRTRDMEGLAVLLASDAAKFIT